MSRILTRNLGQRAFADVWSEMRQFTDQRDARAADEIWFVEHEPVYTLGLNADRSHLLSPGDIPVHQTDRGGQVTYHGPGQQVVYLMLSLKRLELSIRSLVEALESSVIETVAAYDVEAYARRDAPGVYVEGRKLGAIGLRVRRGCTYHGIAVNVNMDLEPFSRINPCGMQGLAVTQLADLCEVNSLERFRSDIEAVLLEKFA